MKRNSLYLLAFLSIITVIYGCYKDKGNYTYVPINEITLSSTSDTFHVMLPDSLKIDLQVTQTEANSAGISYQWVMFPASGTPTTRRTLDTTRNLRAKLTELPGVYWVDAYAKDRNTGVEFRKRFVVNVVSAYSEGWVIVEQTNGGTACDLSMITPSDLVFRKAYSSNNNNQFLPAGISRIPEIKTISNEQRVYVMGSQELQQLNYSDFRKIAGPADIFWQAPSPVKASEFYYSGFDEMLMNDGRPFSRSTNAPGISKLNLPPVGSYYMAPFEIYGGAGYTLYDTIGRKFFKLDLFTLNLVAFAAWNGTSAFDMNNIGKRMIYAEASSSGHFAFFQNINNDSLFAFNFNLSNAQPAVARYDGLTAPGLVTSRSMVMSRSLPYLYYAHGNSIYKLDIPAKSATPIYTFPVGTEIRAMKMYRNMKTSSDPNQNKLIGVATHENGEGKVYYFPIAATGNFTSNTYSKVFGGFGMINEITFKSQK